MVPTAWVGSTGGFRLWANFQGLEVSDANRFHVLTLDYW